MGKRGIGEYTPKEFDAKKRKIGVVNEAVKEGIELMEEMNLNATK